jgi:endonuclease/exonuclease/phosphatase family metal-dependent hydrolase
MARESGAPAHPFATLLGALLLLLAPGAHASPCGVEREWHSSADGVRWVRAPDRSEWTELDAWCEAVGRAALVGAREHTDGAPAGRLVVVAWNTNVGGGSIKRLVRELAAGELTEGRPVPHYVLLLQEVFRSGDSVPAEPPADALAPRAIQHAPEGEARMDVLELARELDLHAVYAPSMRNGLVTREDRGNAILSTLPLEEPLAVELPLERQRRIALAATVSLDGTALRVINVHLDNFAAPSSFHRGFGTGRERQARWIEAQLRNAPVAVLGGDLNTWYDEAEEGAISFLRRSFPFPELLPIQGTLLLPFGLSRQVDYLLFRLPPGGRAGYRPLTESFGSDHLPLLGELSLRPGSG